MLRVYSGDKKGATAFFRNRCFVDTINSCLLRLNQPKIRVMFHSCSVGAEPYSFAITWQNQKQQPLPELRIDTTDIEPNFVETAKKALYQDHILESMSADEQRLFERVGGDQVRPIKSIRDIITFREPSSLLDFAAGDPYDAVFAMNVLTYLTEAQQTEAIQKMAQYARHYLCVTAFHPDQIQADIRKIGFAPVTDNLAEIHNAWGDRLRPGGAKKGTPEYSWVLPEFETVSKDFEWRYCAIFRRV